MTRKERLLAAMRGQAVDRIPFATYNLHPYRHSAHSRDPSYRELLDLVVRKAGMICKCGVADRAGGADQGVRERVETRGAGANETNVTTLTLPTPKGDLTSVCIAPRGQPSLVTEPFVKTDADIERYLSLPFTPPQYDISEAAALYGELGDRGLVYISYSDPMSAAAVLFGYEDFIVRCAGDCGAVKRLVDHLFERIVVQTQTLIAACRGYDFLFYTAGPEYATPPMMAPATFRSLVTPYQKRLIEMIHAAGQLAVIHCHGRVRAVLDEILATGADMLEPIEPPDQGDIALAELIARAGQRLCLMGHIQDQELYTVPPGAMTRRVTAIAELVKGRSRYIMTPTCTPFQHPAGAAYLRNYAEWIEAADRLLKPT
jgi:uroporphyrinogen-III decarboxylase